MSRWLIAGGLIALAILMIGFATNWSLLGLLNRVDSAASGIRQPVERGIAYGRDPRQKLNIFQPTTKAADKAPVIVFFYGGSWNSGNRDGYDFVARAMAEQGFLTVIPDYRLVPQVRYPGFVEDGAAALAWVAHTISDHGGDPARVTIVGHSAGAYIAAMLALDPRWLKAAGAPDDVVRGVVGLAGPYDFYPYDTPASKAAFSGVNDPASTQPVNHARADAPPLLLMTGLADTTVKPRHSQALAKAMTEKGGSAIYLSFEKLDHKDIVTAFARPFRDKAPLITMTANFLKAHSQPLDKSEKPH